MFVELTKVIFRVVQRRPVSFVLDWSGWSSRPMRELRRISEWSGRKRRTNRRWKSKRLRGSLPRFSSSTTPSWVHRSTSLWTRILWTCPFGIRSTWWRVSWIVSTRKWFPTFPTVCSANWRRWAVDLNWRWRSSRTIGFSGWRARTKEYMPMTALCSELLRFDLVLLANQVRDFTIVLSSALLSFCMKSCLGGWFRGTSCFRKVSRK